MRSATVSECKLPQFVVILCFKAFIMNHFIKVCFVTYICQGSLSAPRQPRLSLAENFTPTFFLRNINGTQGTYSFGYDITDTVTGNTQFRSEERYSNGTVVGNYGYVDPSGSPQNFRYIADEKGYRVFQDKAIKNHIYHMITEPIRTPDQTIEPSVTWTRPKKTNKKKPGNMLLHKMPVYKRPQEYNLIGPPSSYIEY